MSTQPPLPLIPAGASEIGAAAAMIEDHDGGRVYVHGNRRNQIAVNIQCHDEGRVTKPNSTP